MKIIEVKDQIEGGKVAFDLFKEKLQEGAQTIGLATGSSPLEFYKQIREMNSATDYEYLQDELIDRFGEYPDVVAYLLEIGLVKAYLDQVFVRLVERKQQKVTVKFEPIAKQLFLTQDYFKALSMTQLKAQIAEEKGLIEVIFDIRNKKDFEILEALKQFGQTLLEIKQEKEED